MLLFRKIWLFIVKFPLKLIDESKSIFSGKDLCGELFEVEGGGGGGGGDGGGFGDGGDGD